MIKRINKILIVITVIMLTFLFTSCNKKGGKSILPSEREKAYNSLKIYLEKEYGEEFIISHLGKRNDGEDKWYEGTIYPKSYEGTEKLYDSYYKATGYYDNEGPGDNYSKVLLLESMSEYFRPQLEEKFGKNILSIFNLEIGFGNRSYEKYIEEYGYGIPLNGAIYIFGSIKTEKDIKKYQKGIFEFVQQLKAANNFEYVKLAFIVIDERVLEDDFYDLGIKRQLIDAKEESKTEKEFLAKRDKIMSQIKITSTDKSERIEGINRGEMDDRIGHFEYFGYTSLMGTTVMSPLMLKSNSIYEKMYPKEVGKVYEKKEEIELHDYINYFFRRN